MVVFSFPSIDFFLSPIFKLFCYFLHQKIEICTHDDWLEGVTRINEMPRILISFSPLLSSSDFHSIDSVVHKSTHTHTCPHTHILVHFRPPLPNTNPYPLIPESLTHSPTRQPPAYLGKVPRCWHESSLLLNANFMWNVCMYFSLEGLMDNGVLCLDSPCKPSTPLSFPFLCNPLFSPVKSCWSGCLFHFPCAQ